MAGQRTLLAIMRLGKNMHHSGLVDTIGAMSVILLSLLKGSVRRVYASSQRVKMAVKCSK